MKTKWKKMVLKNETKSVRWCQILKTGTGLESWKQIVLLLSVFLSDCEVLCEDIKTWHKHFIFAAFCYIQMFFVLLFRPTLSSASWPRMECAPLPSSDTGLWSGGLAWGCTTMPLLDTQMGTSLSRRPPSLQKTFLGLGAGTDLRKWKELWVNWVSWCTIWLGRKAPTAVLESSARRGRWRSLTLLGGWWGCLPVPAPCPRAWQTCLSYKTPLIQVQLWRSWGISDGEGLQDMSSGHFYPTVTVQARCVCTNPTVPCWLASPSATPVNTAHRNISVIPSRFDQICRKLINNGIHIFLPELWFPLTDQTPPG